MAALPWSLCWFRPCVRGSPRGFADVPIPSDQIVIRNIAIFQTGDWISIRLPEPTAAMFFDVPPAYRDERVARQFEREVIVALRTTNRHVLAYQEGGA